MKITLFISTLLVTIGVVSIAMLYLKSTTRLVITELCQSEAGAEFWLKSANILAYSGSLILVLIYGKTTSEMDIVDALRTTLILTLTGIFITVWLVAQNVWRTVSPKTVTQNPGATS